MLEGPLSGNYLIGVSSGCEFTTVIDFTLCDFVCRNNLYISNAGGYLNDRDENRLGNVQLHSLLNTKKKRLRKRKRTENTVRREGGT